MGGGESGFMGSPLAFGSLRGKRGWELRSWFGDSLANASLMGVAARLRLATRETGLGASELVRRFIGEREPYGRRRSPLARYAGNGAGSFGVAFGDSWANASLIGVAARLRLATRETGGNARTLRGDSLSGSLDGDRSGTRDGALCSTRAHGECGGGDDDGSCQLRLAAHDDALGAQATRSRPAGRTRRDRTLHRDRAAGARPVRTSRVGTSWW